jgi:hypothetical protein
MVKTACKWALRLAALAAVASTVARILRSTDPRKGPEGLRVIGGDTWPPVPVNPARRG